MCLSGGSRSLPALSRPTSSSTALSSAMSQAMTCAAQPWSRRDAMKSPIPGASGPRLEVSTMFDAPCVASHHANCRPSAPVPPVTSAVPLGLHSAFACGTGAGTSLRTQSVPSRAASSSPSSSGGPQSRRAAIRSSIACSIGGSGKSSIPAKSSGFSRPTARPRPQRLCNEAFFGTSVGWMR